MAAQLWSNPASNRQGR